MADRGTLRQREPFPVPRWSWTVGVGQTPSSNVVSADHLRERVPRTGPAWEGWVADGAWLIEPTHRSSVAASSCRRPPRTEHAEGGAPAIPAASATSCRRCRRRRPRSGPFPTSGRSTSSNADPAIEVDVGRGRVTWSRSRWSGRASRTMPDSRTKGSAARRVATHLDLEPNVERCRSLSPTMRIPPVPTGLVHLGDSTRVEVADVALVDQDQPEVSPRIGVVVGLDGARTVQPKGRPRARPPTPGRAPIALER